MRWKDINTATRLARFFTEEIDLPGRLKDRENKKIKNINTQKDKENSGVEQRFQDKIKSWEFSVKQMGFKLEEELLNRILYLNPKIEQNITNAAYCKDFQEFTAYFITRRDYENCDNEELGQLAQLHTAFQQEIDKIITSRAP
jgi:hypothetical protein